MRNKNWRLGILNFEFCVFLRFASLSFAILVRQARGWLHTHWLVWLHADNLKELLRRCERDDSAEGLNECWLVSAHFTRSCINRSMFVCP